MYLFIDYLQFESFLFLLLFWFCRVFIGQFWNTWNRDYCIRKNWHWWFSIIRLSTKAQKFERIKSYFGNGICQAVLGSYFVSLKLRLFLLKDELSNFWFILKECIFALLFALDSDFSSIQIKSSVYLWNEGFGFLDSFGDSTFSELKNESLSLEVKVESFLNLFLFRIYLIFILYFIFRLKH